MLQILTWFGDQIYKIVQFLDTPIFQYNSVDISLLDIDIVFLALGLIAAVFWRGAKT